MTAPIFGVGSRNFIAAADDKIPNTYLVNNHQGKFNSTHNMFFDMLAAQGIVGTVLMLAAMVLIIICIIRLLGKNLKEDCRGIRILFAKHYLCKYAKFVYLLVFFRLFNALLWEKKRTKRIFMEKNQTYKGQKFSFRI